MLACTVVARNYLAHARVVSRSYLEHHPDSPFVVLVLDAARDDPEFESELFEVLTPYDIGIDETEVHRMATIYDVMEFATAVKPWLLIELLRRGGPVCYLDPDIEVFAPLDDIADHAEEHGVVLTPHVLQPLDRDGLEPSETVILRAGMFNLGFVAVGEKGLPFLNWWAERLARECVVAPEQGRFVDQRWVDFVPSLFDHVILRDPGLNVAWWNLSGREVRWNGRWEVDGSPIRFFHFSGYSPEHPNDLTRHAGGIPRLRMREQPGLIRLCAEYASQLREAGYSTWSRTSYALAASANGVELSREIRGRYRAALKEAEETDGVYPPDPFNLEDAQDFADWVGGNADRRPLGVNVVGYLRTESGVGEAARQLIRGVAASGVPYSTLTYENTTSRQKHQFEDVLADGEGHPVNIVCVNADQLPILAAQIGDDLLRNSYTVGVWFWEAPVFPRSMHIAFDFVDEVWVASSYVADAISAATDKPVHVFPLPVVVTDESVLEVEDAGLPSGFVFLFCFDFLSVFDRKNPLGLIEAFKQAFPPDSGPKLVIKSINGSQAPEDFKLLRSAAAGRDDIQIMDGYMSVAQKDAMIAGCGCYVSLHRSEGFGLTMAEAMMFGRPVIATGHGGNTTFMTDENSFEVPFSMTRIPDGSGPYAESGEWAEPDLGRASELMRWVYEHPKEAGEVALRGRTEARAQLSAENAGVFIEQRLREIQPLLGRLSQRAPRIADAFARAEVTVAGGAGGPAFFGSPTRVGVTRHVRKLLWRMLFPFLQHQNQVDRALVAALAELREANRRLELRVTQLEARGSTASDGASGFASNAASRNSDAAR